MELEIGRPEEGPTLKSQTQRAKWLWQLLLLALLFPTLLGGCSGEKQSTLRILVAASAREATQTAVDAFSDSSAALDDTQIVLVSGPSNGLSQQILAGAPADIFISANPRWTAAIADQCDAINDFVGNRLVLATRRNNTVPLSSLADLSDPDVGIIAIASESVPLGDYAREVIGKSDQLRLLIHPKLVSGKDASALVAWLENREAEYGFVYASDLNRSETLKEALAIDPASHSPITYSIAKLKNDQNDVSALRDQVYDWLQSEPSMQIYKDAGFVPLHQKPPAVSHAID